MKKTRFLVLALAVSVILMGAGYAAWTDSVVINDTLQTGHLDMCFDNSKTETEIFTLDKYVTASVSYAKDKEKGDGQNNRDVANVKLKNLYPGATASVKLFIKNNSTIPVCMNAITDTRSANWGANDVNFEQISATVRYFDASGTALDFSANTNSYANPWSSTQLQDAEIPVDGYATIEFGFKAAEDISEDATYEFNVSAVFKQFNK